MKNIKVLLAILLSVVSFTSLAADKIAVVNVQEAIKRSESAKLWIKKFESEHASEQADLRLLESEFNAMQERYKKDEAILSDEEKRKTTKAMKEKVEEFQFRNQKLQKEYKSSFQEFMKTMGPKVNKALGHLMEENSYDMIIHRDAVLGVAPKFDITGKVIEQLNKEK